MGLKGAVARVAVRHAHVLLVEAPGNWLTRVAVERHALGRGWRLALSPADADVLAVCGEPGPELGHVVARLWDQMPGPRARVEIESPDAVPSALDEAEADLLDVPRQKADSHARPVGREAVGREEDPAERHGMRGHGPEGGAGHHAMHGGSDRPNGSDQHHGGGRRVGTDHGNHVDSSMDDDSPQEHGNMGPAERAQDEHKAADENAQASSARTGHGRHANHDEMGHGGHAGHRESAGHGHHGGQTTMGHGDHAGHGGVGHAGMDLAPGGIPLAQGGEDRDGLEMDLLHVRLGPVLAYWPAGLVLRCTLQGDVIVDAQTTLIDSGVTLRGHTLTEDEGARFAARRCDNAANLLALAGWDHAASRARGIRDALLFTDVADPSADLDRLRRAVRRSWMLRWSLRRIGPLTAQDLTRRHLPSNLQGDSHDRLLTMLDRAAMSIAGNTRQHAAHWPAPAEAVADLVRGWDLAAARLIVASLDLDPWTADRVVSHA